MSERRTLVLVHGAWHGAWCWERVTPHLDAAGVPWRALDLPLTSLVDDAAATKALVDSVDGPVVLVGHSYGGIVLSAAGDHPAVERLVFVAALAVDADEVAAAVMPEADVPLTELGSHFQIEDGQASLDHDGAIACLYNRCAPDVAEAAYRRLRPIHMDCFTNPPGVAAWRTVPSTYLVCSDDQGIPAELQRLLAARAGSDVVEWDVDHSPFLCAPAETAQLLIGLATS